MNVGDLRWNSGECQAGPRECGVVQSFFLKATKEYLDHRGIKIRVFRVRFRALFLTRCFPDASTFPRTPFGRYRSGFEGFLSSIPGLRNHNSSSPNLGVPFGRPRISPRRPANPERQSTYRRELTRQGSVPSNQLDEAISTLIGQGMQTQRSGEPV